MKFKVFVSLLAVINIAYALSMEEAVELAMQNNHQLKQKEFDYFGAKERTKQQNAAFLPRIDAYYGYNEKNKALPNQNKKDSIAGIRASYNLFNGLSDKYGVDSVEFLEQNSYLLYSAAKRDIALQTKQFYIQYLQAVKNESIADSSLKMFQKHFEDATHYFNQGLIAENDLLEVEVQLLDAMQSHRSAQREVEIAKIALENSIGVKITSEIEDIEVSDELFDYESLLQNLTERDEIKALQSVQKSVKSAIKANRGNFLPRADISFSYNKYGKDWDLAGLQNPNSQSIASFELSWNLFAGGAHSAQEKIYHYEASGLNEQTQALLKDIELQFNRAWSSYLMHKDNLKTAQKALTAAQRNYEISQRQFYEGILKSSDLITANHLLTRAKQNYNNASYDMELAIQIIKRVAQVD